MRRTALILAGLFLAIAQSPNFGIAPAQAQMDWLTPNLEAQRYNNMRRHQQRLRTNQQHMRSQRPTISPQRRQQLMRQIGGGFGSMAKQGPMNGSSARHIALALRKGAAHAASFTSRMTFAEP